MAYICPKCQGELKQKQSGSGMFFQCDSCGTFCSNVSILKKSVDSESINRIWAEIKEGSKTEWRCPFCDTTLKQAEVAVEGELIHLQNCNVCLAVWGDQAQVERFHLEPENSAELAAKGEVETRIARVMIEQMARDKQEKMVVDVMEMQPASAFAAFFGGLAISNPELDRHRDTKPILTRLLVLSIIAINLGLMYATDYHKLISDYGFIPDQAGRHYGLTWLTNVVLHASMGHLLGNMFFFYMFGVGVEKFLGHKRYAVLLLATALFADFSVMLNPWTRGYIYLGASGMIAGVIAFYCFKFPTARIYLRIFFRHFIKFPMAAWGAFYFISEMFKMFDTTSTIGHNAHIGGAVGGILTLLALGFKDPTLLNRSSTDE